MVLRRTKGIGYLRVCSGRGGNPELRLEVQQAAIEALIAARDWQLIAPWYCEALVDRSGRRPQLHRAIERCRDADAILIIAGIGDLSRNLAFLAVLRDSKINFVAADKPDVNAATVEAILARINGTAAGAAVRQRRADERAEALRPTVEKIQAGGHHTLRAIALELERSGAVTPRGGRWHAASVRNLLARLGR